MQDLHTQQEKALEVVKDWSKWLAGLNFGSAAGCILMLQQGISVLVRVYLVSAVLFFSISLLISSLIFLLLPIVIQKLPLHTKSKGALSIYDYELFQSVTLRLLVGTQFGFFVVGIISLFTWVMLKK